MASNPLIDQGSLNRLRGGLVCVTYPTLNVTASFLGKAGISLSLEGDAVTYVETLTGAVTSPQPYMMVSASLNLLKTQNLAALYKAQMETDARIGALTIKTDSSIMPDYLITNSAIQSVREMSFAGEEPGFMVTIRAYYLVNNNLWNLV